MESIIRS